MVMLVCVCISVRLSVFCCEWCNFCERVFALSGGACVRLIFFHFLRGCLCAGLLCACVYIFLFEYVPP